MRASVTGTPRIAKISFLGLLPDGPNMALDHPDDLGLVIWRGLEHAFCRRVPLKATKANGNIADPWFLMVLMHLAAISCSSALPYYTSYSEGWSGPSVCASVCASVCPSVRGTPRIAKIDFLRSVPDTPNLAIDHPDDLG